jgi:hypothetical protein
MEEISFTETLYRKLHSNKVRHDEAFGPLTRDARVPASEQEIDAATDFFQDCMTAAADDTILYHRSSPQAKPGWTLELTRTQADL